MASPRRGASGGAVGTVLLLLSSTSTERPSVSGSHERAQCPARRRPRAAVVPGRPRLSGRLAFPWHPFPASPTG